ncbi:MAG: hypothetical protein ABSD73_07500 [Candidatus Bathyarchaeia archaeon]|jgi:NhaP-type Na+/H+ or K+/H+ antiporter
MNPEIGVEGQLVENVLKKLESEFSERISPMSTVDRVSAVGVLNQTSVEEERQSIRKDIMKALLVSNQTQRIYFVVRSVMMTILGAIITLAIFWRLGTINVIEDFVLGISTYAICLVLSRLFDKRIVNISKKIIVYLGGHTKLRDFIVRNF